MSAIAMFTATDGSSIHLITDGAYYDAEGRVRAIKSKVTTCDRLRMAVAVTGNVDSGTVARHLASATTQREALQLVPSITSNLHAANAYLWPHDGDAWHLHLMLFVATWTEERGAEGWVCASGPEWLGDGYKPGTLAGVSELSSPPISDSAWLAHDPEQGARRVLTEQRFCTDAHNGQCCVGGFGEMATVDAIGVRTVRLIEWPDKVGERIVPQGNPA